MYSSLRELVARVLRVPTAAPRPPDGVYQSIEIVRASPRYLSYRLLGVGVGCVAALAAFSAILGVVFLGPPAARHWGVVVALLAAASAIGAVLVLSLFLVRLDYDLRFYVITDRSLRVREGSWTVKEMTLTFANVQNVRIEQGPLQRLFRISDLVVDTAGGATSAPGHGGGSSGHRVTLAGLDHAPAVRDRILEHVRKFAPSSGLGDIDDPGERGAGAARRGVSWSPEALAELRAVCAAARELRIAAEGAGPGSES